MKAKTYSALSFLILTSTNTHDLESFRDLVKECKSEVTEALQQISDTDNEAALDASHFSLYINSDDEEIDDHVSNCLLAYLTLIEIASDQYEDDLSKAVDEFINGSSDEDQCDDIIHLEKCLSIQPEELIK